MLKKRKRDGEEPPTKGLESNKDVKYVNSPYFYFCDNSYLANSYTTLLYITTLCNVNTGKAFISERMKHSGEGKKKKRKKKDKQPEDKKKGANNSDGSSDECVGEES